MDNELLIEELNSNEEFRIQYLFDLVKYNNEINEILRELKLEKNQSMKGEMFSRYEILGEVIYLKSEISYIGFKCEVDRVIIMNKEDYEKERIESNGE